jgi:hypothetical protein
MLAREERVQVEMYNVIGQRVAVLFDGVMSPHQTHTLSVPADRHPSGVYFLRVRAESFSDTRQMVIVH